jgi:hypothetical protein
MVSEGHLVPIVSARIARLSNVRWVDIVQSIRLVIAKKHLVGMPTLNHHARKPTDDSLQLVWHS